MSYTPRPAPFVQRASYRTSFLLGLIAATPYLLLMERVGDALTDLANRRLPDLDGAEDGACLVASLGPYFSATSPGFRRHKATCFLRGYWFPRAGIEAALAGSN